MAADLDPDPASRPASLEALARPRPARRTGAGLKARALRLLARREYSRAELRRKLLLAEAGEGEAGNGGDLREPGAPNGPEQSPDGFQPWPERIDALLDELEAKRLLSDHRYAEVLVSSKGERYGLARLSRTLATQGVRSEAAAQALEPLRATERERALAVWKRRFAHPPADLKERARQHRFLIGRGFDPATVSWVLKQVDRSRP